MGACDNCKSSRVTDLKKCGGCLQVSYCSPQCQKMHWRTHKSQCKPFKLTELSGKGLGLVSTRVIKKAEVVIREKPTLIRLKVGESLMEQFQAHSETVQTEILALHHDNPGDSLERRVREIFLANACDIGGGRGVALYPTLPRMNHSCAPNVVWSHKTGAPLTKEVRALRDIMPGEELCPNYIDSFENTFSSSNHRRRLLSERWNFDCGCPACNLPSEEQQENDHIRERIATLHSSIPRLMSDWRVEEAHKAAVAKLELMSEIPEHVASILPSAMMEVVEMTRLAELRGVKLPDQSHLVTEAQELSRQLGDSFVEVTNEKLRQIDANCEMLRKKKRKG